jgi:hypothetical protein
VALIFQQIVYRLPEEPPSGTVVRPDPDNGERHQRNPDGTWVRARATSQQASVEMGYSWGSLLGHNPGGLVVVHVDPHPTPWTHDAYGCISDANGRPFASIEGETPLTTAIRIVKAVNEATP